MAPDQEKVMSRDIAAAMEDAAPRVASLATEVDTVLGVEETFLSTLSVVDLGKVVPLLWAPVELRIVVP